MRANSALPLSLAASSFSLYANSLESSAQLFLQLLQFIQYMYETLQRISLVFLPEICYTLIE